MQRRIHFGEENHLFLDLNDPADFVEFGPSSDALRSTFLFQLALLGVLAFVLPLLLVLITGPQPAPSEILGNWWREIQAHQILISFAASIFAYSAYFSSRNYQRIWIENGRACFIRSRIWPRLKSEPPLSEFSGVGFWFDGDGGHHHVRLPLSNEKDHVGAISTVELRHSDHDKCFPLLRLPAAQWLDEYQREFALELATPVVLPGTGEVFSPSPLADLKQRLRDSTLFHAYSEGPVKVVSREDGETTVEYPFAPFDLLNVVSLSAAIPLVMPLMTAIVAHLYKSDFGNVLNFHP